MPRETSLTLSGLPALAIVPTDACCMYVLAHGAGAGMRHAFLATLASALAERRIATLRWEFPYMTAGKPRPDPPAVAETAVRSAWDAARAKFGDLPMYAGGKSFGGRMTSRAHAAAPLADLRGLAFLGFPLHPPERPGPRWQGGAQRAAAARTDRASTRLSAAQRAIDRAEHLAAAPGRMLFLQGDRDELADLTLLRPVVAALGRRAKLHVVTHADHGFEVLVRSGRTAADVLAELVRTLATWMR